MKLMYILLCIAMGTIVADTMYLPYHTSHVRVHRDQNNQSYSVELPIESYAIDDEERTLSVPPVIIPLKPVTYDQDEPELDTDYEPELLVPNM